MSASKLTPDDLDRILAYLDLPTSDDLPVPPVKFLDEHLSNLPYPLLVPFADITTPRERTSIKTVKSRRLLHATSESLPPALTAERGRLRWPLLWERMGGASLPPPTSNVVEEENWVEHNFLPGAENAQHVKKLGGLMRSLQEEREMMDVVAARRIERRLDTAGEAFEDDSEDEELDGVDLIGTDENRRRMNGTAVQNRNNDVPPELVATVNIAEQEEIKKAFERRLLELFLDGLDTIDYTAIDFTEPDGGNPIAARDEEDAYFDDQEPSRTPNGHVNGDDDRMDTTRGVAVEGKNDLQNGMMKDQNGQGEYDY